MAFPADGEAAELVEQGDALFHDVAQPAEALDVLAAAALDVLAAAARNDRLGPALAACILGMRGCRSLCRPAAPGTGAAAGQVVPRSVRRVEYRPPGSREEPKSPAAQ